MAVLEVPCCQISGAVGGEGEGGPRGIFGRLTEGAVVLGILIFNAEGLAMAFDAGLTLILLLSRRFS